MISEQAIDNNVAQGISAYVDYLNNIRLSDLMDNLTLILKNEADKLTELASRELEALNNINLAKVEIDNLIKINRGGDKGVHGFIAEFAETGITNARRAFEGLSKSTFILNDNGSADLLVNNKPVQMKFYANLLNEIKTSAGYEMDMMFPKDHMEVFQKIMNGDKVITFNGGQLSNNQINKIRQQIEEESSYRGLSWEKWMKSSQLEYKQVQKGRVNQTLSKEADNISNKSKSQKREIKKEADKDRNTAYQKGQPSFNEATRVAGVGAAVQGGFNFAIFVYNKHREGKDIWKFTSEDWKESGIVTARGALKGGVSGYAIYGLTNVCHLAAPSAGAITSGMFGLANAIIKFRSDEVDEDGFIDLVTMNAIDATGAAVGAAVGQTIIPIPVVGALVGSLVSTTALKLGKEMLNKHERELINNYQKKVDNYIYNLDKKYKEVFDELMIRYEELGQLQEYSFNFELNIELQLATSIELAKASGVSEKKILHNEREIDNFFLS